MMLVCLLADHVLNIFIILQLFSDYTCLEWKIYIITYFSGNKITGGSCRIHLSAMTSKPGFASVNLKGMFETVTVSIAERYTITECDV